MVLAGSRQQAFIRDASADYALELWRIRAHRCGISVAFSGVVSVEKHAVTLATSFDGVRQFGHAGIAQRPP